MAAEPVCCSYWQWVQPYVVYGFYGDCLGRIRQWDEANKALRTELKEADNLGEERYRHDRDTARQEAEETTRQVAEATAKARARTMPLVPASVDTKLISKPETFSGKVVEWPRWSLMLRAYLGAVSGRMLELLRTAETQNRDWTVSTSNLEATCWAHGCTLY